MPNRAYCLEAINLPFYLAWKGGKGKPTTTPRTVYRVSIRPTSSRLPDERSFWVCVDIWDTQDRAPAWRCYRAPSFAKTERQAVCVAQDAALKIRELLGLSIVDKPDFVK